MKTTLLIIAALALVNGTASVRAEDTRSQVPGATNAGGASTVSPYFWTENNDAQIHLAYMVPAQCFVNPQRTASQAYFLGGIDTATALSVRALD